MHEASIASEICMIVEDNVIKYDLKKVTIILIKAGTFNAIDKESLTFAFKALSKETVYEKAEIQVETVEGFELMVERIEGE